MIPIIGLALAFIFMVVDKFLILRKEGFSNPDGFVDKVIDFLKEGRYQDALSHCEGKGTLRRMLEAGWERRAHGREAVEESIREAITGDIPRLEKFLPAIGAIAVVEPLLGLLGTVSGMISTFDAIALHGSGDPGLMAGGISEALITTESGLSVAIPAILLHAYFSHRVDRVVRQLEKTGSRISDVLADQYHATDRG